MKIVKYQLWHFLLLVALLAFLYNYACVDPVILQGELWGISTLTWFVLAILSPIVHQLYVLLCWRYELYYNSVSNFFGKKGFGLYKKGFAFLILSRPITIILLAISNAFTLPINTLLSYVLSGILLIPGIYLFYSIKKYFGFDRAFGIDHFYPEKFKNEPMVKRGIFKYSANAMYVFGFLILWVPGILLQSKAAVLLALFNHIYIWVHYYFTELPDMKMIYKKDS
ncbi:MAG: hypothetical protein GY931_18690 [Maribacter sp.]|nr:hypothetical protein [Maribacter sp.]